MKLNPEIFREYDIRGVYNEDFDNDFAYTLGRAYATFLKDQSDPVVTVGRDNRPTGEALQKRLIEGLSDSGISVINLGVVTSPMAYFSLFHWDVHGSLMVTASHNPSEYNGFKISLGKSTLYGVQIQEILQIIQSDKLAPAAGKKGSIKEKSIQEEYVETLSSQFNFSRPLKIAIDCGNGSPSVVAPEFYKRLGCEVTELYCESDGTFPNHHPDPTVAENLKDLIQVLKEGDYDLGLAFDGDGDRIGAVDPSGEIIWGDQQILLFARSVLKEKPGSIIIGDVKCSKLLYDDIEAKGGKPIMYKAGHSLIKNKMKQEGAPVAGEMSGHIFFADRFYGFDDALYAGARLLEIVDNTGKSPSMLLSDLPKTYNTPEIRVEVEEKKKKAIVDKVVDYFQKTHSVNTIDGARIDFGDGWGLIRSSNTQPVLVMRFEAESEERLQEIKKLVEEQVEKAG